MRYRIPIVKYVPSNCEDGRKERVLFWLSRWGDQGRLHEAKQVMKNKRLVWESKFQTHETTEAKAWRRTCKDTMAEKMKTGRTGVSP